MRVTVYDARRRLLEQALDLARLQVGPSDETNDANYDAALEFSEENLERAAREFIAAIDEE